VIHRDIKPENILLQDGRPMVADFGIALAVSAAAGGRMTETGLSLGTPHYMSPEQATAERNITNRSDIYSLGAMLYEMLTGDPPHIGGNAQQIIMKIVTEEPLPVAHARKTAPPNVAAAVATALEKLPADRFRTPRAFAEALVNSQFRPSGAAADDRGARRWPTAAVVVLVSVALAAGLAGGWGWLRSGPSVDLPTVRFVEDLGNVSLATGYGRLFDIASDGSLVVVGIDSAGVTRLFFRRGDVLGMEPIPETENPEHPVFDPAGDWIAFVQGGDLKRVPVDGGPSQLIARDSDAKQLNWSANGQITFAKAAVTKSGIFIVPEAGGRPVLVPGTDNANPRLLWPELLPDDLTALVTLYPDLSTAQIALLNLQTGSVQPLGLQGTHAHYLRTEHLVYGHPDGGVMAVPFHLASLSVTGEPASVLEGVAVAGGSATFSGGATQLAVSQTGFVATLGVANTRSSLLDVDPSGLATAIAAQALSYPGPQYSPNGRFIAFEDGPMGRGRDIYLFDRQLEIRRRLTYTEDLSRYANWSNDGQWIYFASRQAGARDIDVYRRRADLSGEPEHLAAIAGYEMPQAVLPDGRVLVRTNPVTGLGRDLMILTPGDTVLAPFLANPSYDEFAAKVSPDGRWVAYTSNETRTNEVYVTSFPTVSSIEKVSEGGGSEALWSPDGERLFYWAGDALMAATFTTGDRFTVTGRSEIFSGSFARYELFRQYDVHPDGSFVMFGGLQDADAALVIAANWFSELRVRMGERP